MELRISPQLVLA